MAEDQYLDNASETPRLEMGGQAVIEGVLMRSRTGYAVALRREDGKIRVRQVPYAPMSRKYRFLKLPILRGFMALFEMMAIGIKSLNWSAEEYENGLKEKEKREAPDRGDGEEAPDLPQSAGQAYRQAAFLGMLLLSLGLVILMLVVAPNVITAFVGGFLLKDWAQSRGMSGFTEQEFPFLYNLLSGLVRAVIIVGYVWVIAFNKEIRRVFQYHGAEHKAVLALEDGGEVTVAGAQAHDTLHPRCGTTFIAVVILVSIVIFAAAAAVIAAQIPSFHDWHVVLQKLFIFACHIVLLPLVAGVAFEIMKFCARHQENVFCRLLIWPGYKFQRITTRQPDDSMVEVAIVSMLAALAIPADQVDPREHVVRGLQDDKSAPGFVPRNAVEEAAI